jgi:outer membrane lipoprotein-sorting protein
MKKRFMNILSIFGLALTAPLAMAQEAPLPELETVEVTEAKVGVELSDIEAYLNNIKTMTADFVQITTGSSIEGKLSMSRPGRVRFEYAEEYPVLVVSDGNNVSFIDYELGQVTRWPVNDTPLAFLLKAQVSLKDDVTISGGEPDHFAGSTYLTASDPKKPEQGELTLIFTGHPGGEGTQAFALKGWEVIDAQGNITNIRLANSEFNMVLDSDLWEFEDPRNERLQRRRRR